MARKTLMIIFIGLLVVLQLIWLGQKRQLFSIQESSLQGIESALATSQNGSQGWNNYREIWAAFYLLSRQTALGLTPLQKKQISPDFLRVRRQTTIIQQNQKTLEERLTGEQVKYILQQVKSGFPQLRNYPCPNSPASLDPWPLAAEQFLTIRAELEGGPSLTSTIRPPVSLSLEQLSRGIIALEKRQNLRLTPGQAREMLTDFHIASAAYGDLNKLACSWLKRLNRRQVEYVKGHLAEIREISSRIEWSTIENSL